MDREESRRRAAAIEWFHSIDLGDGIVTDGKHDPREELEWIGVPADLTGRSVLDIGAWDGFYAFEAERRGATRVLAVDSFCWGGEGWGTKEGFDLAREALRSRVEDRELDVLDLSPESVGVFDVVLFLDVLYHMRHPLLALEKVASVTGDLLVLQTVVDLPQVRRPAVAFYAEDELAGDLTNWWAPNVPALVAMLRDVGFRDVTPRWQPRPLLPRLREALVRHLKLDWAFLERRRRDRLVIHARK